MALPDRISSCGTPGYEFFKPELQAAKQAGALVTSEVELFFELCPCEIVAVTALTGKTTTTTLIAKMFETAGRKVFLGGQHWRSPAAPAAGRYPG